MTRARSASLCATPQTAQYYEQRAGAGLIISEGIPVSDEARGYIDLPGITTAEQVDGWRLATTAVHEASGCIIAQLWHAGRVSHTSLQPHGGQPVSASARIATNTNAFAITDDGTPGFLPASAPRALETQEVERIVADFGTAAANAITAGFDGVEIHGANGYLFEQFLNPTINDRSDRYGGSVRGRAQILLDVVDQAIEAVAADRVGVRLSPFAQLFDNGPYEEAEETYLYLAGALGQRNIAYVHLHEVGRLSGDPLLSDEFLQQFRSTFGGPIILAGALDRALAEDHLRRGLIDLAAFGRPYVANPDLARRLEERIPLNDLESKTLYGGDGDGYTNYPPAPVAAETLSQVSRSRSVAAAAADVWELVSDFGGAARWITQMPAAMEIVGDPATIGAERIVRLGPGVSIVERLVVLDHAERTTSYCITQAPVRLDNHRATLKVTDQGATTMVEWSASFITDVDQADGIAEGMATGTFEPGLQRLAELLEQAHGERR